MEKPRFLAAFLKLPSPDRSRTNAWRLAVAWPWTFQVLGLECATKREQRRASRVYPNPIARARVYERALAEPAATYRTVAAQFGVTREEVCQFMILLKRLPESMIVQVEQETDPSRLKGLSVRRLLRAARSPV